MDHHNDEDIIGPIPDIDLSVLIEEGDMGGLRRIQLQNRDDEALRWEIEAAIMHIKAVEPLASARNRAVRMAANSGQSFRICTPSNGNHFVINAGLHSEENITRYGFTIVETIHPNEEDQ